MALEIGALPCGQWTGCHSTPIDAEAPPHGDRKLTDKTNRLSYPYGVLVDVNGRRFFDEGEDFQFYTYAKLGGIILNQTRGVAYQVFDAKVTDLLEGRYKTGQPAVADTLAALVAQLPVDQARCLETLEVYNAAVGQGAFDPTVKDGLATSGLALPKSNWAQRLDTPPFTAWPVTGGITFTFGGVRVNEHAQVQEHELDVHPWALRVRRDGRRALPRQLPGRDRPDVGCRVRPARRRCRRGSLSGRLAAAGLASDDAAVAKAGDVRAAVAQLGEDCVGVLAEQRGPVAEGSRGLGQIDRRGRERRRPRQPRIVGVGQ
jgi:hypothetical protein